MGALDHDPVPALALPRLPVHAGALAAALLHVAQVHLVLQDTVDRGIGPVGGLVQPAPVVIALAGEALIRAGTGDVLGIEDLGDLELSKSLFAEIKDPLDHTGGGRIDLQPVVICGVFPIAVAGEGSDKLPAPLLGADGGADLVRNVLGILGVEEVFDGQEHIIAPLLTVHPVVDGDEAHPAGGEFFFQIAAHFDVVPPEPGEVLDQNAVDGPGSQILLHAAEGGTVKIGAGVAVILVEADQAELGVLRYVLLQKAALVGDAVALALVAVLPGEAQIPGRIPCAHGRPSFHGWI